jgi:hypothetical protein
MNQSLHCHNRKRERLLKRVGAVVALIAVLAIFVVPGVNMQPTALRASRAAQNLLVACTLLVLVTAAQFSDSSFSRGQNRYFASQSRRLSPPSIIALVCARLC